MFRTFGSQNAHSGAICSKASDLVMKASELRDMSDEQLGLTLKETANSYFKLRTQGQTEKLDAPSELRKSRRLISRIKTIQREREIKAAAQAATDS